MGQHAIKILIVDDNEKTRDKLIEQLRFDDVAVVGESNFGAAAYTWAQQLDVDVVIVLIEEPLARSLRTIESLAVGARSWPVLGISSLSDRETMRKAVVAGVRDYLVWPAAGDELHQTVLNIHRVEQTRRLALEQGQTAGRVGTIVAVAGVKGGIGKSTVATNIATTLAEQTRHQIAMVDLDLQFGDAAVMLDLVPPRTIEDATKELTGTDPQLIHGYLVDHASRLKLLAAPATPEGAETITEDQVGQILEMLAATNDYVIVDTSAQLDPVSMRVMDFATLILLVVVPEVPCVRRTKAALALMQEWGYSRDKVKLVVNRSRKKSEVSSTEIEQVLQYPIYAEIPDDRAAARGISIGAPAVLSAPKSDVGRAFTELGRILVGLPKPRRRLFRRIAPARVGSSDRDLRAPLAQSPSLPEMLDPSVPAGEPGAGSPAVEPVEFDSGRRPIDVSADSPDTPRAPAADGLYTLAPAGRARDSTDGHADEPLPLPAPFRSSSNR